MVSRLTAEIYKCVKLPVLLATNKTVHLLEIRRIPPFYNSHHGLLLFISAMAWLSESHIRTLVFRISDLPRKITVRAYVISCDSLSMYSSSVARLACQSAIAARYFYDDREIRNRIARVVLYACKRTRWPSSTKIQHGIQNTNGIGGS